MECAMLAPKAEVSVFPLEGTQGSNPAGGAADSFVSQGASACLGVASMAEVHERSSEISL
jgi:hypothetical protein